MHTSTRFFESTANLLEQVIKEEQHGSRKRPAESENPTAKRTKLPTEYHLCEGVDRRPQGDNTGFFRELFDAIDGKDEGKTVEEKVLAVFDKRKKHTIEKTSHLVNAKEPFIVRIKSIFQQDNELTLDECFKLLKKTTEGQEKEISDAIYDLNLRSEIIDTCFGTSNSATIFDVVRKAIQEKMSEIESQVAQDPLRVAKYKEQYNKCKEALDTMNNVLKLSRTLKEKCVKYEETREQKVGNQIPHIRESKAEELKTLSEMLNKFKGFSLLDDLKNSGVDFVYDDDFERILGSDMQEFEGIAEKFSESEGRFKGNQFKILSALEANGTSRSCALKDLGRDSNCNIKNFQDNGKARLERTSFLQEMVLHNKPEGRYEKLLEDFKDAFTNHDINKFKDLSSKVIKLFKEVDNRQKETRVARIGSNLIHNDMKAILLFFLGHGGVFNEEDIKTCKLVRLCLPNRAIEQHQLGPITQEQFDAVIRGMEKMGAASNKEEGIGVTRTELEGMNVPMQVKRTQPQL